eukprot:3771801-Rhodomonas_salina.1
MTPTDGDCDGVGVLALLDGTSGSLSAAGDEGICPNIKQKLILAREGGWRQGVLRTVSDSVVFSTVFNGRVCTGPPPRSHRDQRGVTCQLCNDFPA